MSRRKKRWQYVVNINANDYTVEVKVDERLVDTDEELAEIVSKINNKEIKPEVYYKGERIQLYEIQGEIGAEGLGLIGLSSWFSCTDLILALSHQLELRYTEEDD